MIKSIFIIFVVWILFVMMIQVIRKESGKQLIPTLKLFGLGILGAAFTSVALFLFVTLF
jgi:CHASE1-domain containing sensor protein